MNSTGKISGVVLAGGLSSRMGQDKALLDYKGKSLLRHMVEILGRTGIKDVYVSGNFKGYNCISDPMPHAGPGRAIQHTLAVLEYYDGILFIPVDMPLLQPAMLRLLLKQEQGAYFSGYPLPVYIVGSTCHGEFNTVKSIIEFLKISPISLPKEFDYCMMNANTPQDWNDVMKN